VDRDSEDNSVGSGVVGVSRRVGDGAITQGRRGGCDGRVGGGAGGSRGGLVERASGGGDDDLSGRGAGGSRGGVVKRGSGGGAEGRRGGGGNVGGAKLGFAAGNSTNATASETRSARSCCAAGAHGTSTMIGSEACAILRVTFIFNVAWRGASPASAPPFPAGSPRDVEGSIRSVAPRAAICRSCERGAELGGGLAGEFGGALRSAVKKAAIWAWSATRSRAMRQMTSENSAQSAKRRRWFTDNARSTSTLSGVAQANCGGNGGTLKLPLSKRSMIASLLGSSVRRRPESASQSKTPALKTSARMPTFSAIRRSGDKNPSAARGGDTSSEM